MKKSRDISRAGVVKARAQAQLLADISYEDSRQIHSTEPKKRAKNNKLEKKKQKLCSAI